VALALLGMLQEILTSPRFNSIDGVTDVRNLDAVRLLTPFLDVVRSGDTSGPITAIALSSVDKFITYGLVHKGSPNLAQAMTAVAGAGTHCKFEASDSVSDEVVLLKILDVLKDTLTSDLGDVLSDEAVCEMMETGLSMCCQMRLSGKCKLGKLVLSVAPGTDLSRAR
jgi:brefeldin A-resistance guanine nucleotide exchange factor 1